MDKENNEKERLEHPLQVIASEAIKTNMLLKNIELTLKDINSNLERIDSNVDSLHTDSIIKS